MYKIHFRIHNRYLLRNVDILKYMATANDFNGSLHVYLVRASTYSESEMESDVCCRGRIRCIRLMLPFDAFFFSPAVLFVADVDGCEGGLFSVLVRRSFSASSSSI